MSDKKTDASRGVIYDDFGNIVKLPDGMVERTSEGGIKVYKPIHESRIRERNAGCWNCLHAEAGPVYDLKVQASYERDVGVLKKQIPRHLAEKRAGQTRTLLASKKGLFVICTGGGVTPTGDPVGDFVSARYLCRAWSGVTGAALARAPGEALSPLLVEEYDKLGETAPTSEPDPEPASD